VYPCADDRWLAVSVADDTQWRVLAAELRCEDDEGLATVAGRHARHDELDDRLTTWAAGRHAESAAATLVGAGVPAALCRDPRGISAHPQYVARRLYERLDHPVVGPHVVPSAAYRFASVDTWLHRAAPTLGQHTAEVLTERLGYTDEEVAGLVERGITGNRPRGL
jgi:crotonobetainyl-CoA:carnitine CoA-transferase CaiB-like acyl-CoA transferase